LDVNCEDEYDDGSFPFGADTRTEVTVPHVYDYHYARLGWGTRMQSRPMNEDYSGTEKKNKFSKPKF
jgi:hypothetical protein